MAGHLRHLSPLAGRGRLASGALAKRSKSGEGAFGGRAPGDGKQGGGGGVPRGSDSRRGPLTRIPSLRFRFARNPTSPRTRGEVECAARLSVAVPHRGTSPAKHFAIGYA